MSKKNKKAFVDGVNVLDSNPKAYKYVKKKIQKAGDGDKFVKAGELAKQHLQQSKAPDWNNIDYGYNSMLEAGIPHNQAIGVMANTVQENRGSSKGAGIIQWINNVPKGSEAQWKSVIDSIVNPANTYNRQTDSMDNWWGKFGKINGKEAQKRFKNPNTSPLEAAEIYSASYIRPGKPEIEKRKFFAQQLDSIYNPQIKDKLIRVKKSGGLISKAQEGTKFQNLIGNVSNFLKSDSGQAMISGASQLFKTFKSSSDLAKQQEELNKWKKAYVNSIVPEDASQQVEQEEVQAKQANPDYNSSPIYKAWRQNQLEQDSIQAAKQKAAQQADMYIQNKLLEQQEQNNESLKNGMEDFFNKGLGMLSQYIGNKNNAPSVVTPIKDYAKEFKQNTNSSINDMNFKVAMATKDPTYRLPNYTFPSISDYQFSWQYNK